MASVQPGQASGGSQRSGAPVYWGVALIAAGLFFLGFTLGILPALGGAAAGWVFIVLGVAVLASYLVFRAHWWTLIAGPTLLGLGAVIVLPGGSWGGLFLAGIGIGFALTAATNIERWWAIIPAGTLITLGVVSFVTALYGGTVSGAVLFLGLAATFALLGVIKVHGRTMRWPIFPALGCLFFGVLIAAGSGGSLVWPVLLIAGGVLLLARTLTRRT